MRDDVAKFRDTFFVAMPAPKKRLRKVPEWVWHLTPSNQKEFAKLGIRNPEDVLNYTSACWELISSLVNHIDEIRGRRGERVDAPTELEA